MTDISRLQVQLQVTKLQNKDNPLYQLLHGIISSLKDTDTEVKAVSGNSGSTVTNNITNNSYTMQSGVGSSSGGLNVTSTPIFTPPVIPTLFTPGSVLFAGISGLPSQDNSNLFWDDANNRLGIGTASPGYALDVISGNGFQCRIRSSDSFAALLNMTGAIAFKLLSTKPADSEGGSRFVVRGDTNQHLLTIADERGNIGIGTFSFPTSGQRGLYFGVHADAVSGLAANTAGIYGYDVGGTVNMFGISEDGTVTRLTWGAPQTYTETNVTIDRSFDANATSLDEIADVLGTLIADLRARGQVN